MTEMTTDNSDNNEEIMKIFNEKEVILMKKAGQKTLVITPKIYTAFDQWKQASQGQGGYTEVYIAVGQAEQAGQGLSGYTEAYTAAKKAYIDSKMRLRY